MSRIIDHLIDAWALYVVGLIVAVVAGGTFWIFATQPDEGYVLDKSYSPERWVVEPYYDPNLKMVTTRMQYYGPSWALWLCEDPPRTEDNKCRWRNVSSGTYDSVELYQYWRKP